MIQKHLSKQNGGNVVVDRPRSQFKLGLDLNFYPTADPEKSK